MAKAVGGNTAAVFLGSYNVEWAVVASEGGRVSVEFLVTNTSTAESAFRIPVVGYQDWYRETVGAAQNAIIGDTGPDESIQPRGPLA